MKTSFAAAALVAALTATGAQADTLTKDCTVYPVEVDNKFQMVLDTDTNKLSLTGIVQTPNLGGYRYEIAPLPGLQPNGYQNHMLLTFQSPGFGLAAIGQMNVAATFDKPVDADVINFHVVRDWNWGPNKIVCPIPKAPQP